VGTKYMRYGYGYGGPCLPRDNRAFAHYAERIGLEFPLGRVVDQFNHEHTQFLIAQLVQDNRDRDSYYMPYITYKPGTDIVEESQQLAVCRGLLATGFRVYVEPSDLIPASLIQDLEAEYGQRIQFRRRDEIDDDVYEVRI
jgi:UDPglucose 6-dehydrogenase